MGLSFSPTAIRRQFSCAGPRLKKKIEFERLSQIDERGQLQVEISYKRVCAAVADLIRSDRFQPHTGRTRRPSKRLHSPRHRHTKLPSAAERGIGAMQVSYTSAHTQSRIQSQKTVSDSVILAGKGSRGEKRHGGCYLQLEYDHNHNPLTT